MTENTDNTQNIDDYDITVIRPAMNESQIQRLGKGRSEHTLESIKKALRKLHTLELMASTIYRFQLTGSNDDLERQLIAAMCNEMTHYQDFTVLLYEYGFRPSIIRPAFWFAGAVMGIISRKRGKKAILKLDVWVETLATEDYHNLLDKIDWDEHSRKIIEKNQADEFGHIDRWKALLAE